MGALVAAQLIAAPVYAQESGVWVELHTDDSAVRIERIQNGEAIPVCAAPCKQRLPRDGTYRIAGDGITPSQSFDLSAERWVRLDVKAGFSTRRSLGIGLGIAGYATAVVGSLYFAAVGLEGFPDGPPASQGQYTVPEGLLISGLAAGVIGLVLVLTCSTEVRSSNGATFSSAPEAPRHKRPAIVLTPRGLEF